MATGYYQRRILILIGIAIAFVAFRSVGHLFGIPESIAGYSGSILAASGGVIHLIVLGIIFCALCAVLSYLVRSVRRDAALFCVAIGLVALSRRAGETRFTLFGRSNGIWWTLAIETLLLGGIVTCGWLIARHFGRRDHATIDEDAEFDFDVKLTDNLLAVAIHAFAMLAILSILCRSDSRLQCLFSVAVAAWVASVVTHLTSPARPSIWFWCSPIVVGIVAYIVSSFSGTDLSNGQTSGYFAALARPLPLDYASAGIAGAMLGYWSARSWDRGENKTQDRALEAAREVVSQAIAHH